MLQASEEVSSEKARADWERDLDTGISEDVWDSILALNFAKLEIRI